MGDDLERRGPMIDKGVYPVQVPRLAHAPSERPKVSVLIPFIVVANVAMFVITMAINNCPQNTANDKCFAKFLRRFSFQPLSENPLLGPSTRTLQNLGALDVNKIVGAHQGWRLVTSFWLHAGVIHILVNMFSLLFIGIKLEQQFGFARIGSVYLLSGLGGSLLSALFLRDNISVGASGALFGLLGAMLSELLTNWTIYSNKCAALIALVLVVVVNLTVGILPHVDNFAHIGGFISGFLAGFVLLIQPQAGWVKQEVMPYNDGVQSPRLPKHKLYQYILCIMALVTLILGLSLVMVLVLQGVDGNKKCSWCHYMSCVPTSRWNCNNTGSQYCSTVESGNQLQLTCVNNNKTISTLANQSQRIIESLCGQLCS